MNISLRYFSGTGNSRRIADECRKEFENHSNVVDISSVTKNVQIPDDAEWVGLVFPVYAFGIPRICKQYLKGLGKSRETKKAFVIVTPGAKDESGFSIRECQDLLRRKNIELVYGTVIQMPINWTTFVALQPSEEAAALIEDGVREAARVADEVLAGQRLMHRCKKPDHYSLVRFHFESLAFKFFGIRFLWRLFSVTSKCNGCGKCAKTCPTRSIAMTGGNPKWTRSCEQCMRCVNTCPNGAIFQKYGVKDQGKQRYMEPNFQPMLEEKAS